MPQRMELRVNNPKEKRKNRFRPNLLGRKLVAVMMIALATR